MTVNAVIDESETYFYLRVSNNNTLYSVHYRVYAKFLYHNGESCRRILLDVLLVLPHSIFRDFSYHEKSFSGYSTKNLQFQEESAEESTRANLQPSRASCSSWLQIAQTKLPIKIPTSRRKFAKLRGKEHPV